MLGTAKDGLKLFGSHTLAVLVGHGVVGGISSVAGGGSFVSGFLAAGVASLGPDPVENQGWEATAEGTVEHAVLGGVGSVMGGGKFENGAVTGAFGYLFNEVAHTALGAEGYREKMRNCNFADQNCIDRVLDGMEKSNQKLPMPDPRAVGSDYVLTVAGGVGSLSGGDWFIDTFGIKGGMDALFRIANLFRFIDAMDVPYIEARPVDLNPASVENIDPLPKAGEEPPPTNVPGRPPQVQRPPPG